MTEEERKLLGERRRLIFENVANGVPPERVAATFKASLEEVGREVTFVAKKIAEYRFQRRLPPIQSDTLAEIRQNRLVLLATLTKIGPITLSTALVVPKLAVHKIETPAHLIEAGRMARVRVNQVP